MKVKIPITFALVCLAVVCVAQKPSDWRRSKESALAVASKMDAALFGVKNAEAKGFFVCSYEGNRGQALIDQKIRDRKNFRLSLIRIDHSIKNPFSNPQLIANKGEVYYFSAVTGAKKLPVGKDPNILTGSGDLISRWPKNFVQVILQSFVTGKGAGAQLVKELMSPKSGYDVTVETRTMQSGERKFPQARIIAVRKPSLAKKLGKSQFEIVVDKTMWLPLQVRVVETKPKVGTSTFEWTTAWKGGVAFDSKTFVVPKA